MNPRKRDEPAQAATLNPPGSPCSSSAQCASGCCCNTVPAICVFDQQACIGLNGFVCLP